MYNKIIIPLDMSELGEQVLKAVGEFAVAKRSEVVLVHCLEPHKYADTGLSDDPNVLDNLLREEKEQIAAYLSSQQKTLQNEGYVATVRIGQGDAAQYIVDVAVEEAADLIAMTTHGRTGILRSTLGSVADRVVRMAHQPVLLLRSQADLSLGEHVQHVLVPVDGSAVSERVLSHAKRFANLPGTRVTLLQVLEPMHGWEKRLAFGPGRPFEEIAQMRKEKALNYLHAARTELENLQISVTAKLHEGNVADSILQIADEEKIDLIVMGTHGYGGAARWLYGSVANRVLHGAKCPLMVVRQIQEVDVQPLLGVDERDIFTHEMDQNLTQISKPKEEIYG